MVNLRKTLVIIAAIVFCFAIVLLSYMHISYAYKMPKYPDPSVGRTHLLVVNHGARIYVTENEMLNMERVEFFSFCAVGVCFLSICILNGYYKTF